MKRNYKELEEETVGYIQFAPKEAIANLKRNEWWFTDTENYSLDLNLHKEGEIKKYFKNKNDLREDPFEGKILTMGLAPRESFISCFSIISKDDIKENGCLKEDYINYILPNGESTYKNSGLLYIPRDSVRDFICKLNIVLVSDLNYMPEIYCRPVDYVNLNEYIKNANATEEKIKKTGLNLNEPGPLIKDDYYKSIYETAIDMITLCKPSYFARQHEARIGINFKYQHIDRFVKLQSKKNISQYFEINDEVSYIRKLKPYNP